MAKLPAAKHTNLANYQPITGKIQTPGPYSHTEHSMTNRQLVLLATFPGFLVIGALVLRNSAEREQV
jgi:hypothetical protein